MWRGQSGGILQADPAVLEQLPSEVIEDLRLAGTRTIQQLTHAQLHCQRQLTLAGQTKHPQEGELRMHQQGAKPRTPPPGTAGPFPAEDANETAVGTGDPRKEDALTWADLGSLSQADPTVLNALPLEAIPHPSSLCVGLSIFHDFTITGIVDCVEISSQCPYHAGDPRPQDCQGAQKKAPKQLHPALHAPACRYSHNCSRPQGIKDATATLAERLAIVWSTAARRWRCMASTGRESSETIRLSSGSQRTSDSPE